MSNLLANGDDMLLNCKRSVTVIKLHMYRSVSIARGGRRERGKRKYGIADSKGMRYGD